MNGQITSFLASRLDLVIFSHERIQSEPLSHDELLRCLEEKQTQLLLASSYLKVALIPSELEIMACSGIEYRGYVFRLNSYHLIEMSNKPLVVEVVYE